MIELVNENDENPGVRAAGDRGGHLKRRRKEESLYRGLSLDANQHYPPHASSTGREKA